MTTYGPTATKGLYLAIEADAGVVFEELLRLWREHPFEIRAASPYAFKSFQASLAPELSSPAQPLQGTLLQSEALDPIQKVLPRGGHIVYDAGKLGIKSITLCVSAMRGKRLWLDSWKCLLLEGSGGKTSSLTSIL
jgi:hypothetical protein